MGYTFEPEKPHAKAYGNNLRISPKNARIICTVIKRKKLSVAKRLLQDVIAGTRSLRGKYFTNASKSILELLESCEANAKSLGLDVGQLFVHASATHGTMMRRGRRKSSFGSRLKTANVEVILVQRSGSVTKPVAKVEPKKHEKIVKPAQHAQAAPVHTHEHAQMKVEHK